MAGSNVVVSPIVIIRGGDSGACGGWTVMGGNVSSRGKELAFAGRTLMWPDELEVVPNPTRGLSLSA